jgi:hypothetical protein
MRLSGRTTQPYRKNATRAPSSTLTAQKRGRTLYGQNRSDIKRLSAQQAKRRRRRLK